MVFCARVVRGAFFLLQGYPFSLFFDSDIQLLLLGLMFIGFKFEKNLLFCYYMNNYSYIRMAELMVHNAENCQEVCFHPDVIDRVRKEMPGEPLQQELAQLFKVLGDYTRIRILNALYRSELCVCDLTSILGMNQSAVSHQLRVLRDAKIVKSRKKGKNVLYSLDDGHISGLIQMGSEHVHEEMR